MACCDGVLNGSPALLGQGGPAAAGFLPIGSGTGGAGSAGSLTSGVGGYVESKLGIKCPSDFWVGVLVGALGIWLVSRS
jgi:hypothetical protein